MKEDSEVKEVKTDNELIAEFMGIKFVQQIGGIKYYNVPDGTFDMYNVSMGVYRYHKSWDCLMPVVEKITPLSKKVGQQAWFDTGYFLLDGNIKVVYERTVQFIKWYNEQKA